MFEDRLLRPESAFIPGIGKDTNGEERAIGEVGEDSRFAGGWWYVYVGESGRAGGGDDRTIGGTGCDGVGCIIAIDNGGIGAKIVSGAAGVEDGTSWGM